MPYFSVVIPLYNKQNYITAALNSISGQTFTDFEVVVVNDVSTDNSLAVARQVQDSRISFMNHEVNKGLSASRNTGIKSARAQFIAFLDADDVWHPNFLKEIHNLTLQHPDAGIFATAYNELHGTTVIEHPHNLNTGIINNFFEAECRQHIYCYSSVCIKKEVFGTVGYFDETITMGEDVDFNVRANLAFGLAYSNKALATVTMQSENQITHSALNGKVIIDHNKYEQQNPDNSSLKKYLDFHRYTMAKRYKIAGNHAVAKKLVKAINAKNLNYKQRILLAAPAFALKCIKSIKKILAKKGLNPTTY